MWGRVVEIVLGCWLAMSPFIFRHDSGEIQFWVNDFSCALVAIVLAAVSWWKPTRHAHVGNAALGIWMITFAYLQFDTPTPPALQNDALVGLLLIMFGVIPNQASLPPAEWQEYASRCEESNVTR